MGRMYFPDEINEGSVYQNQYCFNCGQSFKMTCPKCRTIVKSTDNFCPNCGLSLKSRTMLDRPTWFGVTLGETKLTEVERLAHLYGPANCRVEYSAIYRNCIILSANYKDIFFWDHNYDGIIEEIYISHDNFDFPYDWKSLGFSWSKSYSEWKQLFISYHYSIIIKDPPHIESLGSRTFFYAKFYAKSEDHMIEFYLVFGYKDGTNKETDLGTLATITITRK